MATIHISVELVVGTDVMIRRMNEWEMTLGILCDACSNLAMLCDIETTDCPLFFCYAHAFELGMLHAGASKLSH